MPIADRMTPMTAIVEIGRDHGPSLPQAGRSGQGYLGSG